MAAWSAEPCLGPVLEQSGMHSLHPSVQSPSPQLLPFQDPGEDCEKKQREESPPAYLDPPTGKKTGTHTAMLVIATVGQARS